MWAVYILVEIYSVVMVGIFWTYTNDVVSEAESNRLYGVIGLGGIVGGIAGGAFVDVFVRRLGPTNLLLFLRGARRLGGRARVADRSGFTTAGAGRRATRRRKAPSPPRFEGAREVRASQYLLLIVGIVVAYEFTATLTDFSISVVFEHAFKDEAELAKMYGRLGWIVSATALISQVVLVPLLLPAKRVALLLPPVVMLVGGLSLFAAPVVAIAMFLAASDRGLNYSVHQATKESLYVPLTDAEKYKAKAFIDMFVDRAAKAMAAFALIAIIGFAGPSVRVTLVTSFASMAVWTFSAYSLGAYWDRRSGTFVRPTPRRAPGRIARVDRPLTHP